MTATRTRTRVRREVVHEPLTRAEELRQQRAALQTQTGPTGGMLAFLVAAMVFIVLVAITAFMAYPAMPFARAAFQAHLVAIHIVVALLAGMTVWQRSKLAEVEAELAEVGLSEEDEQMLEEMRDYNTRLHDLFLTPEALEEFAEDVQALRRRGLPLTKEDVIDIARDYVDGALEGHDHDALYERR